MKNKLIMMVLAAVLAIPLFAPIAAHAAAPAIAGPITLPFTQTLTFDAAHGAVANDVIDDFTSESNLTLGGYTFTLDDPATLFFKGNNLEANGGDGWCMMAYLFDAGDLSTILYGECGGTNWSALTGILAAGDYVVYFSDDSYHDQGKGTYTVDAGLAIAEEGYELVSVAGQSVPPVAGLGTQICIEEDGTVVPTGCLGVVWDYFYQYSVNVPYSKSSVVLSDFVASAFIAEIYVSNNWEDFWFWRTDDFLGSTPVGLAVGANVFYVEVCNGYDSFCTDYMITINRAGAPAENPATGDINLPVVIATSFVAIVGIGFIAYSSRRQTRE